MEASAPSPNHQPSKASPEGAADDVGMSTPTKKAGALAHGLAMGLTAGFSAIVICACLWSVGNMLDPKRRYLNLATGIVCALVALYVGIRAGLSRAAYFRDLNAKQNHDKRDAAR